MSTPKRDMSALRNIGAEAPSQTASGGIAGLMNPEPQAATPKPGPPVTGPKPKDRKGPTPKEKPGNKKKRVVVRVDSETNDIIRGLARDRAMPLGDALITIVGATHHRAVELLKPDDIPTNTGPFAMDPHHRRAPRTESGRKDVVVWIRPGHLDALEDLKKRCRVSRTLLIETLARSWKEDRVT